MTELSISIKYSALLTLVPLVIGAYLAAAPLTPALPSPPIPITEWHALPGDRLLVDTKENEGYLIHTNGRYTHFPVATGQHRTVCYIGRCYNATTPERTWQVRGRDIKGDRITFGPSGRFLRFFRGDESSPYGIHEYAYEDRMFTGDRYWSMGCVIVKKEVMDILDATFATNEGVIDVVTKYGITDPKTLTAAL